MPIENKDQNISEPNTDQIQFQDFISESLSDNDKAIIDKIASMQKEINVDDIINKYKNAEASNNAEITRLLNLENAKKRSEIDSLISQLSPGIRNLFKMSIIDFKKDIKIKFPNMNLPGALL